MVTSPDARTRDERTNTVDMTAREYREKAVELLNPGHYINPRPERVEQAAIWAQLALSAAISEQKQEN